MLKMKKAMPFLISGFAVLAMVIAGCTPAEETTQPTTTTVARTYDYVLNGPQSTNVSIPANSDVLLTGMVIFNNDNTLTIGEGCTFYGDTTTFSYLIIDRGSQIFANGTAAAPITFTSGKAEGSRSATDWGGIVINGYADINAGDSAFGEGNSGEYGGTNDADNSGSLTYVRIFFAGKDFSADNELNGLCMQGVGSNTVVEHVQMHNCKDDGIEMFGGTVNIKWIVATGNQDDQIDCTYGWRGKGQFLIAAPIVGDKGFEHDNNGDDNAATPVGSVTYYNVTYINGATSKNAILIREGMQAAFFNTYVGNAAAEQAFAVDNVGSLCAISNTLIEGCGTNGLKVKNASSSFEEDAATITVDTNAPSTLDPANFATLAALETAGAAAFAPAAAVTTDAVAVPADTFYTAATFIGAVEDSANNWVDGWTAFPAD